MFNIIWPRYCSVSEAQIKSWYSDAVANGEAEKCDLTDAKEMAHELSSIGHITLGGEQQQ